MKHDLEKLLDKLQLYPDLQKEVRGVVYKSVENALDEVIDEIPVRLGAQRKARGKKLEILNKI